MLPSRVGDDLRASWTDASTLEVTLQSTAQPEWPVQYGIKISVVGDLRDPLLNAPPSRSVGGLARTSFPRIKSFVAADRDNSDEVCSVGDTLTITFDERVRPPASVCLTQPWPCALSGGRRLVDELFDFTHPLGADYSGEWLNDLAFQITILDAVGGHVVTHGGTQPASGSFQSAVLPPSTPPAPLPWHANGSFNGTSLLLAPPMPAGLPANGTAANGTAPAAPPLQLSPPSPPPLMAASGPTVVSVTHWLLIGFDESVIGSSNRFAIGLAGRAHVTPAYTGALAFDSAAANLTGSLGSLSPPEIAEYYTRAYARPDTRPTRLSGAELLLLFDVDSDRGGLSPPADGVVPLSDEDLGAMLEIEPPIGFALSGAWITASALHIVVVDAGELSLASAPKAPPPRSWQCGEATYGTGDGCDCECGALDPDCLVPGVLGAWNCVAGERCVAPGVCSGGPPRVRLRGAGDAVGIRTASGRSAPSRATTPPGAMPAGIPSILDAVAADPSNGGH